jgi:hypothetical protein
MSLRKNGIKAEHGRSYEAHRKKQISHISTNMETTNGLFGTLLCSYLSRIEATSREWRPGGTPTNNYSLVSQVYQT